VHVPRAKTDYDNRANALCRRHSSPGSQIAILARHPLQGDNPTNLISREIIRRAVSASVAFTLLQWRPLDRALPPNLSGAL